MRPGQWPRAAAAAVLACSIGLVVAPPARAEGEAACSPDVLADTELTVSGIDDDAVARPLERMDVPAAHDVTRGGGVTVAVVDSGVGAGLGIDVVAQESAGFDGPMLSGHGTIVAGLVAGPRGVAPDARVLSMRVLDKDDPDTEQGQRGVSSQSIAIGLNRLADLHARLPFEVVNISLSVPRPDPVLERAVRRLQRLDVVVVAAAGNVDPEVERPAEGTPGSDVDVFPADYPGVLTVGAVADDPAEDLRDYVVPNRQTDVAAPTIGGISVNLNGQECMVGAEVATSYAAAEVSGVVALLRARFPKENARQVVARLVRTAEGSEAAPNPWTGAGVVQARAALTDELDPAKDGSLQGSRAETDADAEAPPAPVRPDIHGPSRQMLLWFALLSGTLLALAFLARPLLRRLRRPGRA